MGIKLLIVILIACSSKLHSQDIAQLKKIDSIVALVSEKASSNLLTKTEKHIVDLENRVFPIRFLSEHDDLRIIMPNALSKEDVLIYFLDKQKLIYFVAFQNGDMNVPANAVYFLSNGIYQRKGNSYDKINGEYFLQSFEKYLELYKSKEQ